MIAVTAERASLYMVVVMLLTVLGLGGGAVSVHLAWSCWREGFRGLAAASVGLLVFVAVCTFALAANNPL